MGRKVNIGEKSKVNIKWNVLPMDYSHEGRGKYSCEIC